MRRTALHSLLVSLLLVGCNGDGQPEPYYSNPDGEPLLNQISNGAESEQGNIGGQEVVIEGQNFGDDANAIVVYFGSLNARVVSVQDNEITVISPRGPIQGGAVDVRVATPDGIAVKEGLYTYDVGSLYDNEVAYINASNYWNSCYGGGDDLGVGCDVVTYNGLTGTAGKAEFFNFVFPRVHSQGVGFYGGTDTTGDSPEWAVETPGQMTFASAVDDLRYSVSDGRDGESFQLRNSVWEDKVWCADLDSLASWTYGSEGENPAVVLSAKGSLITGKPQDDASECDDGDYVIDMEVLPYCETPGPGGATQEYEAEWPVGRSFFAGGSGNNGGTKGGPVTIEVADAGIYQEVELPDPVIVEVSEGMNSLSNSDLSLWTVGGGFSSCFDDDGDGITQNDDVAVRFEWEPSDVDLTDIDGDPDTEDSRSYIQVTLTRLTLGWLGGEDYPVRATIRVPDAFNVDEETGKSHLDLPAEVLYQFPVTRADFYSEPSEGGFGGAGGSLYYSYGDPEEVGYGYVILTFDRVTEYRLYSEAQGGDVIFAYSTGDFGFFSWESPLDQGACGNCLDDDGDGWVDDEDPDCEEGLEELGYGTGECNDGLDNDEDGLVDAEDGDCEDSLDEFEQPSACANGEDDDGDGWIDADDPDCDDGDEELGYGDTECNDGVDNDFHGDIDADDPICIEEGAAYDSEDGRSITLNCTNGLDDDEDGYTDSFDPDCELSGGLENLLNGDPSDPQTPECYDGVDNDGDTQVDALDPDCSNPDLGDAPDGFLDDEGELVASECEDAADNDSDGWVDGDDPDCETGSSEIGLGDSECNDGADNDADATIDADDPECDDAADDDESQ